MMAPTESTFGKEPDSWSSRQAGLNFRPYPPNPYRPGSQKCRLYDHLKLRGEVTNGEIVYGLRIANSTGRISEIREFLAPHGIKLHCERVHEGLFVYRMGVDL